MTKNIVFDMGQVLIRWKPEYYLAQGQFSEEEKAMLLKEVFRSVEWVQLDRGCISLEEAAAKMRSRLPAHLHDAVWDYCINWYAHPMVPMPGMAELVRELKGKGYGIYLLSNCSLPLRQHFHRIPGSEVFDGILVSSEHCMIKPQRDIFEKLFETFSLVPRECFFIDDSMANVEAALERGMPGTIFRDDVLLLRQELKENGIL